MMDNLQLFMRLYMFELEMYLKEHKKKLNEISFQSDEANTDRPLKEYIKQKIETKCNCINELAEVENIRIFNADGTYNDYCISEEIRNAKVEEVLLPEGITPEIKVILQSRKNAVFTNPDICLKIKIEGKTEYEAVELKSTKTDSIPGSSVQQVSPQEWVIFIKHSQSDVDVTTGQYLYAINSKMQFPDRSPRPQVSFSELRKWNCSCRYRQDNVITYQLKGDEAAKSGLLTDWQEVLAKEWVDILFDYHPQKREPWFHNNLRKFILEFLKKYDRFTDTQKEEFKAFIESLIV